MRRIAKRRRQPGFTITLGRVQLGLDEEESIAEVRASEISVSEVGAEKVGATEVGALKVSRNKARTSHVGPSKAGSPQISLSEVGTFEIFLTVPDSGPHQLARLLQQAIDVPLVSRQVQLEQVIRAPLREMAGLLQGKAELTLERMGRRQRQRFGEIPQ